MEAEPKTVADGTASADVFASMQAQIEAVEREADEAVMPPAYQAPLGPGGSLPVSDLRERLKLLVDAWVEIYEDGPLRIRFDIEGRRAHVQQTQGTGGGTPDW